MSNIQQTVSQIAFERLELDKSDVLLDVGTGTGNFAIAAAKICNHVIGINIKKKNLEQVQNKAHQDNLNNVTFAYGTFKEPCAEINLDSYNISKILAIYSLHHLPDELKKIGLSNLLNFLIRPGRIVIGDIMFFENPEKHRDKFDDVKYDDGDTDFPSKPEYLIECLKQTGADCQIEQIHPLAGVIIADFG